MKRYFLRLGMIGASLLMTAGCIDESAEPSPVETKAPISVDKDVPAFRANANEPFWTLESDGSGELQYKTPEMPEGKTLYVEDSSAYAKGVNIFGQDKAGNSFTIDINGAACQDTMSDEQYEMTVSLNYDGKSSQGCGTMGE